MCVRVRVPVHVRVCVCVSDYVLQENVGYLKQKLDEVAKKHGERVLSTPHNPISIG